MHVHVAHAAAARAHLRDPAQNPAEPTCFSPALSWSDDDRTAARQDLATAPPDNSCPASPFGEGSSAKAAKSTLAVVQRFVALQQIHMVRAAHCFRLSWTI